MTQLCAKFARYLARKSQSSGGGKLSRRPREETLLRKRQVMVISMLALALLAVATPLANAQFNYTVLHTFTGSPDGTNPNPLIRDAEGNVYGTALAGAPENGFCEFGCGMVFKIDPAGKLTSLYDFPGGSNGGYPVAGVVQDKEGNFYGTTQGLGDATLSVVYKLTPDGKETPYVPAAGINFGSLDSPVTLDAEGNVYGMVPYGGLPNCGWDYHGLSCGTLFKMTPDGKFTTIHTFKGTDGMYPESGLVRDSKGNLYGAAMFGGIRTCRAVGDRIDNAPGCGTIFKVDVHGKYTVLHTFSNHKDGAGPLGLIIDSEDNLYGIASGGGDHDNNPFGYGTIFKLDTKSSAFSVLFTFSPPITRSSFFANLLVRDSNGNLYGAQKFDGANNTGCLFKIDTKGKYTDLYDFETQEDGRNEDGFFPAGVTLGLHGDFYGSMMLGGSEGLGTVFHITP
jgi:uncharacterized repeat protein (TIGR03803 family)